MEDTRLVKFVSLSAAFLLIFAATLSSFHHEAARGEQEPVASPPVGFGPYSVGWIDTDLLKTTGGMLQISIHYPAINQGKETDPNTTEAPYPTLLFSPGFGMAIDNYRPFASRISSWGFVCVLVGSVPESVFDLQRANDLIYALNWLDEQNDNSSFRLSQMMDESKFGVLGHSLGGAAAITIFGYESRFKVCVPIAPGIPSMRAAGVHVPILILGGSRDGICPPSTLSSIYGKANPPKFYILLTGVGHLDIVFNFKCFKYVVSFLKFYLCEDQDYARYVYGTSAQQEIDDGKINVKYELRKVTEEYEVFSHGANYTVTTYSDSTFWDLVYYQTLNQLDFTVAGPPETPGTANITIPKQLAPEGYNITVYLDGESYPFALTNNSASYFVFLTYTHSQHQITIRFADLAPPSLSITSPSADSKVNSSSVTVSWTGSDSASGIEQYEVRLDENSWIDVETNVSYIFTGIDDGNHTIRVKAVDRAGNPIEVQVSFTVKTAVSTPAFWMEWSFWTILCVAIVFSIAAIIFRVRRKKVSSIQGSPTPLNTCYLQSTRACEGANHLYVKLCKKIHNVLISSKIHT